MLHAANAVSDGYKRILNIANDTDIIVLGISLFSDIGAAKLWVSFGLQTNCGTFQFVTSAVRCLPPRQKLFPHSMPWQDQITHPSFLTLEINLLTQNGARGQSSQPRFVIWWISQIHLLQMTSLSSRASSSHCIRCIVLWRMSTKCASRYSRNRLALSSIFRRRKQPWKSTIKERHTKRDMYGANPSSPSKCCIARASGVRSNLKPVGYHSVLPSLEPPEPWMWWSAADAPQGALEGVQVTIMVLCAQLYANAQNTAMGAPILLLLRPQTNNIAVM